MKRLLFFVCSLLPLVLLSQKHYSIVPLPNSIKYAPSFISLNGAIAIKISDTTLNFEKKYLLNEWQKLGVAATARTATPVSLKINNTMHDSQSYILTIGKTSISIEAAEATGIFYGIQTLLQIANDALFGHEKTLQCMSINDNPRFLYRALMIDPARHFWNTADIKQYIDRMARYKFNYLHIHLTDDQGWRIEIKKYPNLTEIGSRRKNFNGSTRNNSGFYTQAEMKDIVKYALQRHVQIIPEFDVPGHSDAAIASYRYLSCNDTLIEVRTTDGVSKNLLCVAKQQVFTFIDDVITELADVFPCPYFHIGGDEAPMSAWEKDASSMKLKQDLHLPTNQHLMSCFFEKVNQSLVKNGKQPLIWFELDVPEYPQNSVMFLWRYGSAKQVLERAISKNFKVICSPGEHAYFDYPQWDDDLPNVDWMPTLSLEQVYNFNPSYHLTREQEQKYIMGVEATLWGESVKDLFRAYYMTYPRALALAEAGWTEMQQREWKDFIKRVPAQLQYLLRYGVNYRPPVELYQQ